MGVIGHIAADLSIEGGARRSILWRRPLGGRMSHAVSIAWPLERAEAEGGEEEGGLRCLSDLPLARWLW
jgi:hypothetical protein